MMLWWIRFCWFLQTAIVLVTTQTTLKSAVTNNDPKAIESFLLANPDAINSREGFPGGQTPLVHAVLTGKLQSVAKLLELGADATLTEKDGYNVMHAAGFQGRAEIASLLIANGLDPLEEHADGYFPIHRACWGREPRHTETVRVFVEEGKVDRNVPSQNGKTCMEMTQNGGTLEYLQGLKDDEL